jgi:hypothetical protein
MFALIGIIMVLTLQRRIPGPRFILASIAVAVLIYGPWVLYQKYYDPPGDRLLKWHLAGTIDPHPEIRFSTLLFQNYHRLSRQEIIANKTANFMFLAPDTLDCLRAMTGLITGATQNRPIPRSENAAILRGAIFFHWFAALDFLNIGIILVLYGAIFQHRDSIELTTAWILLLWTGAVLLAWCLLMFGPPATTLIHAGSYLTIIAGVAGLMLACFAVSPPIAYVLAGLHIILNVVLFVFLAPMWGGQGIAILESPNLILVLLCAIAAVGVILVTWGFPSKLLYLARGYARETCSGFLLFGIRRCQAAQDASDVFHK